MWSCLNVPLNKSCMFFSRVCNDRLMPTRFELERLEREEYSMDLEEKERRLAVEGW